MNTSPYKSIVNSHNTCTTNAIICNMETVTIVKFGINWTRSIPLLLVPHQWNRISFVWNIRLLVTHSLLSQKSNSLHIVLKLNLITSFSTTYVDDDVRVWVLRQRLGDDSFSASESTRNGGGTTLYTAGTNILCRTIAFFVTKSLREQRIQYTLSC